MALASAECGKKVTSLVVTRPNVVLGGLISGEREKIVEERRGRGGGAMVLFAGARPPMPGFGETHGVGLSRL
jgi:hypothetical protein